VNECWKILAGMVVTDGITGQRPDMFLRVQLRAAGRKVASLNVGMSAQIVPYHRTFVPFGAIP
jgi:hypothetical protein